MANSITAATPGTPTTPENSRSRWRVPAAGGLASKALGTVHPTNFPQKIRCLALGLAALLLVAAFVLVPLAVAIQFIVTVASVAWAVSSAVLVELFLLIAFIVLKTEGQEGDRAAHKTAP